MLGLLYRRGGQGLLQPTHLGIPIGETRLQKFNVHEEWQRRQVGDFHSSAHPRGLPAVSGETDEGREILLTGTLGPFRACAGAQEV